MSASYHSYDFSENYVDLYRLIMIKLLEKFSLLTFSTEVRDYFPMRI